MKARYFCLILIAILLFTGLMSNAYSSLGHLGAMGGGLAYMYLITMRKNAQSGAKQNEAKKKKLNKAGLYIVKDDESDNSDPKYFQ